MLAAGTLPTIVFLLVGGIWADRLPRHHVMVVPVVAATSPAVGIAVDAGMFFVAAGFIGGMLLTAPLLLGLAVPLSLAAVAGLAFVAGLGMETFGVLWDTTMQQEIPQDRLSRVYSYDALGSWALAPLGSRSSARSPRR